jgi:hypothetical protein
MELAESLFRPSVLARDRIWCWTSPQAMLRSSQIAGELPPAQAQRLSEVMLASLDLKTRENYGAGLLRFAQYCDTHGIAEEKRCPASELLLSAFIASWAGRISHSAVTGWLAGLHLRQDASASNSRVTVS